MEKFENFITKINFVDIGLDVFNRQQLSKITRKEIGEKLELRIGEKIIILDKIFKIVELVFVMVDNFEPMDKSVDIFSNFDISENNCMLNVYVGKID